MNNCIKGDEIDFSQNTVSILNLIFICNFYFTGMPIFILFVFLALIFKYAVEKFKICYYYSKC